MGKFQAFGPYTQPYLHARDNAEVVAADRKLLRKLLLVWVAMLLVLVFVLYFRHLQGWQVIQD